MNAEDQGVLGGAADAAVRPATRADVAAMGAVQERSWRTAYPDVYAAAGVDASALADGWRAAVRHPPAGHRVLVATSAGLVVGFTAVAGTEIVALHVEPGHHRRGHASRLLAAAVATISEHGGSTVSVWVPSHDDARLGFFRSAGLAGTGSWRELDVDEDGVTLRELFLVAVLPELSLQPDLPVPPERTGSRS